MSTVAGRRCLELALAITLALQSTTGWTVLLAVVVYWCGGRGGRRVDR
ncbi:hypothetical protein [Xanthomonas campestris]|nr:hypothetical protein [Xanthomonas campestris]